MSVRAIGQGEDVDIGRRWWGAETSLLPLHRWRGRCNSHCSLRKTTIVVIVREKESCHCECTIKCRWRHKEHNVLGVVEEVTGIKPSSKPVVAGVRHLCTSEDEEAERRRRALSTREPVGGLPTTRGS